jgi:hypothetical protein
LNYRAFELQIDDESLSKLIASRVDNSTKKGHITSEVSNFLIFMPQGKRTLRVYIGPCT